MIVQAQEQVGKGSEIPTDSHHTPTTTQPSTSKPQKKQSRRKQKKDTEDPQLSGLIEPVTMILKSTYINPMNQFTGWTAQAKEIDSLKKKVKKLEGKRKSKPLGMKILFKIGISAQVVSSKDEGLGDQEDASKQGRKIDEINQDTEVTLVDETQGRYDDNLMFDTGVLDNERDMAEKEVDMAEKDVSTADPVTTVAEVVTTTTTTVDELTLAQTLIEIKAAKPKAVTTAVIRPKARGVAKDKGKAKMIEPEKPSKKKDQIMFDKEVAQKLQAQLDAELEEEEKLARQREENANIAEWDDVQAMMDADYELAAKLQAKEQGELTIEEKSRLFVELMNKRKKHFARLRAE
ncbi:hypothetical protein Tco_0705723 [Tanacetum coccineum]|uniref:Uncharacterized protein n=1 Tax=Tanacetum coccineum TaxID=301880 RepID=A0ABQ4Y7I1_9ASTR